jgi:hypothetical protein
MDFFSFLSLHFMYVTVTVVTGHSVALSGRSHLVSTMSSLHDVLVHDTLEMQQEKLWMLATSAMSPNMKVKWLHR